MFKHLVDPITGISWCNSEVMHKYEIPDNGNNGNNGTLCSFPIPCIRRIVDHWGQ